MRPDTTKLPLPVHFAEFPSGRARFDPMVGFGCAFAAAIMMAATIAVSRLALKTDLAPADLLTLRFGIAGALFLPVLQRTWHKMPQAARRAALPLSFAHGWGMAGLSLMGLALAPAAHAAALGPGLTPLFVALLVLVIMRRPIGGIQGAGLIAIAMGALTLFLSSQTSERWPNANVGDAMFVGASILAAIYLVSVERLQIPALAGNAMVFVFSAMVVVPAYLMFFDSSFPDATYTDIAIQALFQGGLMPLAYVATHHAVLKIGGARVTMIMAGIPVMTLITGRLIAGDAFTAMEVLAVVSITGGVLCGAIFKLRVEMRTYVT